MLSVIILDHSGDKFGLVNVLLETSLVLCDHMEEIHASHAQQMTTLWR
uniref:Uncharacterized protein n=1 Tax=Anguilla anguilla TaxID=7936 RepID=A0A0E9PJT8_ANGAN